MIYFHIYLEALLDFQGRSTWLNIDNFYVFPYVDINGVTHNSFLVDEVVDITDDNIREYFQELCGFNDVIPFHIIKGLPEDVSDIVKKEHDGMGDGKLGVTYYTLHELTEYEPTPIIRNMIDDLVELGKQRVLRFGHKLTKKNKKKNLRIIFWWI